jgi:cytochrome bd-I ubiquinol oxidase subunit X
MWYFSWILGLGLACAFAILNAMWLELEVYSDEISEEALPSPGGGSGNQSQN